MRWSLAVGCVLLMALLGGSATADEGKTNVASVYRLEKLEGWQCHVSPALYEPEHDALRKTTLRRIGDQLYAVTLAVPAERLAQLREVPIWVDYDSPLRSPQYHPSADWLREHGHRVEMAKAVHIPDARYFIEPRHARQQPWDVMHELAHAYHDRVLDFDQAEIRKAYERAKEEGLYDTVLHIVGREQRHYALTDHKEFFAEMTEAYFGTNDFFPFVRGELRRHDPATYELLREIWGQLAGE
jgi:hypothetical protein